MTKIISFKRLSDQECERSPQGLIMDYNFSLELKFGICYFQIRKSFQIKHFMRGQCGLVLALGNFPKLAEMFENYSVLI